MQIFGEIMRRKLVAKGQDGNARHYVERRILTPLGVTIGSWRSGPDGAPLMPQGLVLAASEWAKIGAFVRGGGKLDGKPLVDALAFAELFKGSQANPAYGIPWWLPRRSEERRVGKECVRTCSSGWSPYHDNKTLTINAPATHIKLKTTY